MTVKDIYDKTIKPLTESDRAMLADLILQELAPEPSYSFHNKSELVAQLETGMKSKTVPVTEDTWDHLEQIISTHPNPKR